MDKITVWLAIVLCAAAIAVGSYLAGTAVYVNKNHQPFAEVKTESQVGSGNSGNKPAVVRTSLRDSVVTKVIDGDTVVVSGGDHVRLLGIDADEKGYPCYDAAKARLEELALSKSVELESDGSDKDQYGRLLRYIFLNGDNVNEKLVSEGLAIARFYPENQKYKAEITAAEAQAIKNKTGCKWSGQVQTASPQSASEVDAKKLVWKMMDGSAVDACDAKNHIGENIIVQGTITDSYSSASDTIFFDFSAAYPNNCFAAVIFKSNISKFSGSPQTAYKLKTVRVRGTVQEYQGKPEIIISDPSQIEIGN
jgi:micrococcal nuclease